MNRDIKLSELTPEVYVKVKPVFLATERVRLGLRIGAQEFQSCQTVRDHVFSILRRNVGTAWELSCQRNTLLSQE